MTQLYLSSNKLLVRIMNIILVFAFQNAGIMKYFLSKDDLPIFYLLLQATVKYN